MGNIAKLQIENKGTERLSDFPKDTKLVNGGTGIQTRAVLFQNPHPSPLCSAASQRTCTSGEDLGRLTREVCLNSDIVVELP